MKDINSIHSNPHIYKVTCLVNNKVYVGKHVGIKKDYFASGKIINYAIKKYGIENFKREILVSGDFNKDLLNELEKTYIQLFNSTNRETGYNISKGGDGGGGNLNYKSGKGKLASNYGTRWTKEQKEHLAKIQRQKAKEGKLAVVELSRNKSKEWCKNISEGRKKAIKEGKITFEAQIAASKGRSAPNRVKYDQFDLEGNFIRRYDYASQMNEFGFNHRYACRVAEGKWEQYKGFTFKKVIS